MQMLNAFDYVQNAKYTSRLIDFIAWEYATKKGISKQEAMNNTIHELCVHGNSVLFDFDYPFFRDDEKEMFQIRVCERFALEEIGSATYSEFHSQFRVYFMSNIERINKLYESVYFQFEPLENTSVIEEYQKFSKNNFEVKKESDAESDSGSVNKQLFSDVPQTQLSDEKDYATTLNNAENTIKNTSKAKEGEASQNENEETYRYTKKGNIGVMTYDQLLTGYRNSLLSVDEVVFSEMRDLFMLLY